MSSEERSAWVLGIVAVLGYAIYATLVLGAAGSVGALVDVDYAPYMLATIGGGILAGIIVTIIVGMFFPKDAGKKDERDREISRFGEYGGQSLLVVGSLAALLLALLEADTFWIANVLYLGFVLSAILGSILKITGYRAGFQKW